MVDALVPAAEALTSGLGGGGPWRPAMDDAVRAAQTAAAATATVQARLGRSSYLGERVLGHPDPGARAVVVWLAAIADAL
jgi:dihydroxyacetone kinase